MATETKPALPERPQIQASDHNGADFIFFDEAPNFAAYNGLVAITLTAIRYLPGADGQPVADVVATGHLRTNIEGALSLRTAIDHALLIAAPAETDSEN